MQLIFGEGPAWADVDRLGHQDTGFDYDEIGASRTAALGEMRRFIESYLSWPLCGEPNPLAAT
ncbi:hypothetical protein [Streptomyces sp. CB03238]|uniref:hypothetical protein n=1 Tax=Streptomyces sp. CB03238 TaxID=1907777 RepID=UPI000A1102FC|nr:hypothetical protein [Streptomyces sp. CB03238]ORT57919.1 hypothetical protein BKD26_22435 [Streptomyces sp. CB03238]